MTTRPATTTNGFECRILLGPFHNWKAPDKEFHKGDISSAEPSSMQATLSMSKLESLQRVRNKTPHIKKESCPRRGVARFDHIGWVRSHPR
jgi:hypothetical protein